MGSSSGMTGEDRPADDFARLWEPGAPAPDVFAFLAARPGLSPADRLEVVLRDQELRWRRGEPLPLRTYLTALPDLAERGEMIRALVDAERQQRRRSWRRLNETVQDPSPTPALSEAPTEANEASAATAPLGSMPIAVPPTSALQQTTASPAETLGPGEGAPSRPSDDLGFELEDGHHLRSEAEILKAMLDAVRFTLVRRVGTGGMGVVYEAYDRQRGELVALKTMRRADPTALVRFKQEFRALADITHPNLVNLYELFSVDDRWFFTMELVEGTDFISYARPGPPGCARGPDSPRAFGAGEPTDPGTAPAPDPAEAPAGLSRPSACDEPRLREAFRQLAEGVASLHAAGKLHRDIKPTNVLVTHEGRVVLLDFGLSADLEPCGELRPRDRQIVGTVAHMSPEQAAGLPITPASDWYSVGVVVYEALTGRLPFTGPPQELIISKQTQDPESPSALAVGLPPDLVELCMALLDRRPSRRPTGREVIARLTGQEPEPNDRPEHGRPMPLIGRERHLHVLDAAFAALSRDVPQSVFVFGRTGTGKTALIRAFLDGLAARDEAVVLFGRCYERESVPYKALDCLIDALARHLKALPPRDASAMLPAGAAYLARLFPVLEGVPGVAERGEPPELPDQRELRRRACDALREALRRLAARAPLVLAIDDLQWGDVDSARLIADLISAPQSPTLLLIGSFRSEDAEDCPFLAELSRSTPRRPVRREHRELAVEALTQSEARELALALLGRDDAVARAQAHVVARESGGNPLFVDELVRHIQAGEPIDQWEEIGRLDLDEVLWNRIRRQPEAAQRLLGVVAVSGRPIRQPSAFRAAGLGHGARMAMASLRTARLIRQVGPCREDEVEIYHDRIRETVVAHLPPDDIRRHHERLASVLTESGPADPEVLAGHYRGAGDAATASEYSARGADLAASALAFDHAARLYRTAIELDPGPPERAAILLRKLGDALANAGRCDEAARAYLEAAAATPSPDDALEWKRLAATQLLIGGDVDAGLGLLAELLAPLGLAMPRTPRAALASLLWNRALLKLRGLEFRERPPEQVAPSELRRIDLCWSAVAGLSMFEPLRGADFQIRGLRLALRAGEPFRVARSLAMEAAHRATEGAPASRCVARFLDAASGLAGRLDSPHASGMVELARGMSALLFGRWLDAFEALERAEALFRDHCTGVTWERDTGQNFALWALFQMGRIAELRRRRSLLDREARDRGDRYATRALGAFYATLIRLAADDPPGPEPDSGMMPAARGGRRLNLQQTPAFDSLMHIDLYRGEVHAARMRLEAIWPEYERSLLFRVQLIRIQMRELRARTALATAERSRDPGPLLAVAEADAEALEREGPSWAVAHAAYLRAGIAACRERAVDAAIGLRAAIGHYYRAHMPLHADLMRYRLGEIGNDEESRRLRELAIERIEDRGILAPSRWAGMIAPGFSGIRADSTDTGL